MTTKTTTTDRGRASIAAAALIAGALAPSVFAQELPPAETDAGGANVPNLGMRELERLTDGGPLASPYVALPPGVVVPNAPTPRGNVLSGVYRPDQAPIAADQPALDALYTFASDGEFPLDLEFSNSDPSGSLDRTALDENGRPIHFNLHWPQEPARPVWLDELGIDCTAPTEHLREIVNEIRATASADRVDEALDILLGTNTSGALTGRAYEGWELLNWRGARNNITFDEATRNAQVEVLMYGNEIRTNSHLLEVPRHGDYTITYTIKGLGSIGRNRERAFPIDEFSAIPMKMGANASFWVLNGWIWKWFDAVAPTPEAPRRFALERLWELHTGTPFDAFGNTVPSYADLDPNDPRDWLYANRKLDMGSFVGGTGDLESSARFAALDLDRDGLVGGYTIAGAFTGAAFDIATNPTAQFNQYGVHEYAVPLLDWSGGPYTAPHFAYDSSFQTIRKGQEVELTVRYGQGMSQQGLYVWGWRQHPPRITWIETYGEDEFLPGGAPKSRRFGGAWDAVAALGLDAIGDRVPEKRLHDALVAYRDGGSLAAFEDAVDGLLPLIEDRRALPPTDGVAGFPNPDADINLFYGNLDIWGDRERIGRGDKRNWREGDRMVVTIYNDDEITRYFRVVDFGSTNYQYVGTDMGTFDWKPVFGVPQFAARAWRAGFGIQSMDDAHWLSTPIEDAGNPYWVDPTVADPSRFWWLGERDLFHTLADLAGFSGPGFAPAGGNGSWVEPQLGAVPAPEAEGLFDYAYGRPVPAKSVVTFEVEMPRAAALNNGAMYMFDPQFHYAAIYTCHPIAEFEPEGLSD